MHDGLNVWHPNYSKIKLKNIRGWPKIIKVIHKKTIQRKSLMPAANYNVSYYIMRSALKLTSPSAASLELMISLTSLEQSVVTNDQWWHTGIPKLLAIPRSITAVLDPWMPVPNHNQSIALHTDLLQSACSQHLKVSVNDLATLLLQPGPSLS